MSTFVEKSAKKSMSLPEKVRFLYRRCAERLKGERVAKSVKLWRFDEFLLVFIGESPDDKRNM